MNNGELSYKLKYILHELGMNKTEFLTACKVFSPSISKPTILNAINGKNTIAPTIETLSTIIKVCQTSGNEKLKYISYDFLLNDNIKEVEAANAVVYQSIGLSDDVINRLKEFNHSLYFDYGNIINYFFTRVPAKYWKYLEMFKRTSDILNELKKKEVSKKALLKLFDDDVYLEYLERNFRNIYDVYLRIKGEERFLDEMDNLKELIKILQNHFRYLLFVISQKFLDSMES